MKPRIFRVHGCCYWDDEVLAAPQTLTPERLAEVAAMGYDGIWLHGELRTLVPTALFAPYETDTQPRLAALKRAVRAAADAGLGLWLYLNEPRTYPDDHAFWHDHPECRGHHETRPWDLSFRMQGKRSASCMMCLAAEPVVAFLEEATRDLLRAVPQLAGILLITASEHPTHCYSKVPPRRAINCERCRSRDRHDMPVIVGRAMHRGIQAANSAATLVMWSWSWSMYAGPDPQRPILDRLPPELPLLVDFERGHTVERLGKPMHIDEYSFALVGPSDRFNRYRDAIAATGRPLWAKLQIGATHELATVPNIPVPGVLYDKAAALHGAGVSGVLATWTMALRRTLNSTAAGMLLSCDRDLPPRETALRKLAQHYFGGKVRDVDALLEAWDAFGRGIAAYPCTMDFVYFSPQNYAPAYPWKLRREKTPMARSWMPDPWGDHLEATTGRFTLGEFATMLQQVADPWAAGLPSYEHALGPIADRCREAREELDVARACGAFFQSCANCYAFAHAIEQQAPLNDLLALIDRERDVCEHLIPILDRDPRIGWHDDLNRRMCDGPLVRRKLELLRQLRDELTSDSTINPRAT